MAEKNFKSPQPPSVAAEKMEIFEWASPIVWSFFNSRRREMKNNWKFSDPVDKSIGLHLYSSLNATFG
jgi:hypothetical protein